MRIPRLWLALVVLLTPATVHGDDHFAGRYYGGTYARASNAFGVHFAYEQTLPWGFDDDLSVIGDFTALVKARRGPNPALLAGAGGLRWSFAKDHTGDPPPVVPSIHALVGAAYETDGVASVLGRALVLGGAVQINPADWAAWRIQLQADYVARRGGDNFVRISAGLTHRIPRLRK